MRSGNADYFDTAADRIPDRKQGLKTGSKLEDEHSADVIRERLQRPHAAVVPSAILGGIDGCITTFAIVAASVGGELSVVVIIVLGFANLIADGFSMAVSNYNAAKSRMEQVRQARRTENRHIQEVPEGETEEVRQILERKGLEGDRLESAVEAITSDRRLWVDVMLAEEWGLAPHAPSPVREGIATFVAFAICGLVPLLPFLLPGRELEQMFAVSVGLTGCAFAAIGVLKGIVLETPALRSGLGTLLTGGTAAALAYASGSLLRSWLGGSV